MLKLARHQSSIRWHLLGFGAALLVPILIFSALLLWLYSNSQRAGYEADARQSAKRIAAAVDRIFGGAEAAMEALATSPYLSNGDYEKFQQQASQVTQVWGAQAPGYAIILRDTSGQQLANTSLPWGEPLAKDGRDMDRAVITTKRPQVQDLLPGTAASSPLVAVKVPVLHGDEVNYVLSLRIDPRRIAEVFRSEGLPGEWTGAVVDRNDRIVARSRQHNQFVGALATEDLRKGTTGPEGIWIGSTKEGTPVFGAYARSQLTGWRVTIGVPLDILREPVRRSLLILFALGIIALMLSLLLASWFGQRIATPIGTLVHAASRLGRGDVISQLATNLREVDEVGEALVIASKRLDQRDRVIRESEARLRATYDNAAVGICEVDKDGRFLHVNQTLCKLSRYSPSELIGKPFTKNVHPDDRTLESELFEQQVAGKKTSYVSEKRHIRGDGTSGWLRVSSTAVRGAAGTFLYAIRVLEDITDRKQAEDQTHELRSELLHVSRLAAMGQMASVLAHELNQPLAAVTNYLSAAKRGLASSDDKVRSFLDRAGQQTLRIGDIIQRLRAFVSKGKLTRRNEDIGTVINEAIALALIDRKHRDIRVVKHIAPEGRFVLIDRIHIEQVLVNLIRNASEAMEGAPRREITLTTAPAGPGLIEVSVADTGPGIPPDVMARLFQPFVTTKDEGMGVGLSICRTIIEAHGGHIKAEASPMGGTVFRFTLEKSAGTIPDTDGDRIESADLSS